MMLDPTHLQLLKKLAISSGKKKNLPNGAILMDKHGKVVAFSESLVASNRDATAHAERLVIEKYCKKQKTPFFSNVILVSVIEPCLMCLSAAYWAGIEEIYYIIPASAYWDKIPWMTESKEIDKKELVKKFSPKFVFEHLNQYQQEFTGIFEEYLERVIKR